MQITKQSLINFYLDYVNNYLTISTMAEHYEMPEEDCKYLIGLGKKLNEEAAAAKKVIYYTTLEMGYEKSFKILRDKDNNPFISLQDAINHVRQNIKTYIGLSTYEQMKIKNAEWDNF